ncbi:hypothetical protein VYU27_001730 [Nannochloropsis oceanica]
MHVVDLGGGMNGGEDDENENGAQDDENENDAQQLNAQATDEARENEAPTPSDLPEVVLRLIPTSWKRRRNPSVQPPHWSL